MIRSKSGDISICIAPVKQADRLAGSRALISLDLGQGYHALQIPEKRAILQRQMDRALELAQLTVEAA
jgi:hypothetical protein